MSKIDYSMGTARGTVTVFTEQVGTMSVMLTLNGATVLRVRHNTDDK